MGNGQKWLFPPPNDLHKQYRESFVLLIQFFFFLSLLQLERHSVCAELCLDYALGCCHLQYTHYSSHMEQFHKTRSQVKQAIEKMRIPQKKATISKSWEEI